MPIDVLNHAKLWFSQFSTKSFAGDVIANPLGVAFLIVLILCMTVWIFGDPQMLSFKLVFYLLVATVGIVILSQNIIAERAKPKDELEGIGVVGSGEPELAPRAMNQIPEVIEGGSALAPAAPIQHYPGYTQMARPDNVPAISSSDDLLAYVSGGGQALPL
jgi:hypothetical protein